MTIFKNHFTFVVLLLTQKNTHVQQKIMISQYHIVKTTVTLKSLLFVGHIVLWSLSIGLTLNSNIKDNQFLVASI